MTECAPGRGLPPLKSPPREPGRVYGNEQGGWIWNGTAWFLWEEMWRCGLYLGVGPYWEKGSESD